MKTYTRAAIVVATAALLSSPLAASAETGSVHDPAGDGIPAADITALRVTNGEHRIKARLTIERVRAGRLRDLTLQVKPRVGRARVGAVARRRDGSVRDEYVPVPIPGGEQFEHCPGIRSHVGDGWVRMSVPKRCLGLARDTPVKAMVTATWSNLGADTFDRTRNTKFLRVG